MHSRSFQSVVAGAAMSLAVLVAGCGGDTPQDGAASGAGEPARTTVGQGDAPATAVFARLDSAAFEDRMKNGDGLVVNVHIPYEGELAGTDEFIPFDEIVGDSKLPEDKDRELLLYCRSGNMSEQAAVALHDAGYTKVAHLEGGWKAWQATGRELMHIPAHAGGDQPGES